MRYFTDMGTDVTTYVIALEDKVKRLEAAKEADTPKTEPTRTVKKK